MTCLHCGRILPDNANFCDRCAQPTCRGIPFTYLDKRGYYLQADDRGLLSTRYDRHTRRILARKLHLGPVKRMLTPNCDELRDAFVRLAENSPDLLANMTGGKFLPDADIITVHILFYPGNPDVRRLTPRTYLAVLTAHGTIHIPLPWDHRPSLAEFQPLILHFSGKDRGMLVINQPLDHI